LIGQALKLPLSPLEFAARPDKRPVSPPDADPIHDSLRMRHRGDFLTKQTSCWIMAVRCDDAASGATANMIEEWLTGLSIGPRARNNIRMSIITLFQ